MNYNTNNYILEHIEIAEGTNAEGLCESKFFK